VTISNTEHRRRRQALSSAVNAPVLLMANGERARNLPMNILPWRQDSSFLYFTGCDVPGAAALIEDGSLTLFLPPVGDQDELWHGPTPTPAEQADRLGAEACVSTVRLEDRVRAAEPLVLAVADENVNRSVAAWTDKSLRFGSLNGDDALIDAIIRMRQTKSAAELDAMRQAAAHSKVAHEAVIAATRPGTSERTLDALFTAVLAARGCTTGYGTILTQRGEVLHNHDHTGICEAGRLMLLDGGGEVSSGYGVDITRTWPVSGTFTARQRAAYDAVLAAQLASINACRTGTWYREVHDASSRVIAQFLVDERLLTTDAETAVERGAHALFFPHGVGHHLGLDVHDLENFGDRPSYPKGMARPDQFGTCNLRLNLPLQPDWVVTIEPGFYVVPAILRDATLRDRFKDIVDFNRAEQWLGFGGIRIEDDIRITDGAPEVLTHVAKTVGELEALVGSGSSAEERLLCG
jgi:Xaa-Pro aminopeptidase